MTEPSVPQTPVVAVADPPVAAPDKSTETPPSPQPVDPAIEKQRIAAIKAEGEQLEAEAAARKEKAKLRDLEAKAAANASSAPAQTAAAPQPAAPPPETGLLSADDITAMRGKDIDDLLGWRIFEDNEFITDLKFSQGPDVEKIVKKRYGPGEYEARLTIHGKKAEPTDLEKILKPSDRHLAGSLTRLIKFSISKKAVKSDDDDDREHERKPASKPGIFVQPNEEQPIAKVPVGNEAKKAIEAVAEIQEKRIAEQKSAAQAQMEFQEKAAQKSFEQQDRFYANALELLKAGETKGAEEQIKRAVTEIADLKKQLDGKKSDPMIDLLRDQIKAAAEMNAKLQERIEKQLVAPPKKEEGEITVSSILKTFLEQQAASHKEARELADRQAKEAREAADRQAKEAREAADRQIKEAREAAERDKRMMEKMAEQQRAEAEAREKLTREMFEKIQAQQKPEEHLKLLQTFTSMLGDSMSKSMEAQSKMMNTVGDMQTRMVEIAQKALKKLTPDEEDDKKPGPWKVLLENLGPSVERALDLVIHSVAQGQDPEAAKRAYRTYVSQEMLRRADKLRSLPPAAQRVLQEEFARQADSMIDETAAKRVEEPEEEEESDETSQATERAVPIAVKQTAQKKGGNAVANAISEAIQDHAEAILEVIIPAIQDNVDEANIVDFFLGLDESALHSAMTLVAWSRIRDPLLSAKNEASQVIVTAEQAAVLQSPAAQDYWLRCQKYLRTELRRRREIAHKQGEEYLRQPIPPAEPAPQPAPKA
jgi:hypothetical protein